MINPRELMPGNWVLHCGNPLEIENSCIIQKAVNLWYAAGEFGYIECDALTPMPMSNEVLEHCKAELYHSDSMREQFKIGQTIILHAKKTYATMKEGKYYVYSYAYIEIPSVHWLQNYIFITKGIDLQITF